MTGFEPAMSCDNGFADRSLNHSGTSPCVDTTVAQCFSDVNNHAPQGFQINSQDISKDRA